jgi:hypothetical protein
MPSLAHALAGAARAASRLRRGAAPHAGQAGAPVLLPLRSSVRVHPYPRAPTPLPPRSQAQLLRPACASRSIPVRCMAAGHDGRHPQGGAAGGVHTRGLHAAGAGAAVSALPRGWIQLASAAAQLSSPARHARATPLRPSPQQFENPANPEAHYKTTGPEIWRDTAGQIDILVAGVGTGGTISGTPARLRHSLPATQSLTLHPHEAETCAASPNLGIARPCVPRELPRWTTARLKAL